MPYVNRQGRVELDEIPHDDEPTFEAIRTTHTLGMFQIESPGQRELIGKMQPDRYSDLIADISLFRPGPMKGNMVAPFLDTKHGFQRPDYLHPSFAPFLDDSYGVVIYHEHVLRILEATMEVSLAEADEIRRHMGKGQDDALEVGRSIARSNLFKAAVFGNDPNWGRVLASIGTTKAAFDPADLDVAMNGVWVCRQSTPAADPATVDLTAREVSVTVDLKSGHAEATIWTNDLTHEYVHENSAYSS